MLIRISLISSSSPYFGGKRFQVTPTAERPQLTSSGDTRTGATWESLLAAAQRGDGAAYRIFLESVVPFARSIARRRIPAEELVEDVVQDALLTLHRVRHTWQPGRPVRPWLAAIVNRRAIDAGRRRGRIGAREVHDERAYETFTDPEANREEEANAGEEVARMMAELTPGQKQALELVKLREMSLADASAASGQSIASLKVNVHRAMKKLRRAFEGGRE